MVTSDPLAPTEASPSRVYETAVRSRARRPATLPPRKRVRWLPLAAAALVAAYAVMAWTGSLSKAQSFDEGLQLAVGYNIWLNDDYRIEGANGDLIKRWATLPYLISRPNFVGHDDKFYKAGLPYELAYRFFFELGNRPESLLQQGRAMITLLGIALALLVYRCSGEVFGRAGALLSLAVFAFSPNMLAFGGVVSTDLSITLTLFASTWCVWRLLHEITLGRVLASLGCFGLLVLAKPTALVIIPITAVLVAVKLIAGRPLVIRWGRRSRWAHSRGAQAAFFAGLTLAHAFAGWSAIWAHYGFRYSARPTDTAALAIFQPTGGDDVAKPLTHVLRWAERTRALPEGFRRGVESLTANDDEIGAFMNGTWKIGGRLSFFPFAFWVKSPPAFLILLGCAAVACWWTQRPRVERFVASSAGTGWAGPPSLLYSITPYVTLIGCYLAVALADDLNIGHRHILPIYPALYVLVGAAGLAWTRRIRFAQIASAAALGWLAVDSFLIRPHYLAYFGAHAGGSENGYRHLVDSSLDWGMDLPALREWLDERDPQRREVLFLAYFGTDSPTYHGIESRRLPGFFDRRKIEGYPLTPGYYAISATLLQSVYTGAFGPWSKAYEHRYQMALRNVQAIEKLAGDKVRLEGGLERNAPAEWTSELDVFDQLRFARLCAWLRHQGEPPHHVGHAILIWKLSLADLQAALFGPPVELTDDPLPKRRYGRYYALGD